MTIRRFGEFELDPGSRTLTRDGERLRLHDQPLDILSALLERPGEIVTRDELRHRLWPDGTFVDYDNGLNNALSRLRDALGDRADRPVWIETVPKRGYRFIGEVEARTGPADQSRRPWARWAALAATAAIIVAVATAWPRVIRGGTPMQRILVLPLASLTDDDVVEYIADGVHDDLVTHLGRLSPRELGVIARTTAQAYGSEPRRRPLHEIAGELDVDLVIEGAVRVERSNVHVTLRLVRAADDSQVWAEMFDGRRDDLQPLLARIVTSTAGQVAGRLGLPATVRARAATVRSDAYDAWLQGRHEWNRFTTAGFDASIQRYELALSLDQTFSAAAADLAQAWAFRALFDVVNPAAIYGRARTAVTAALRLDPDSPEALGASALVRLFGDLDAGAARSDFDRALAARPNDALLLHWAAAGASARGEHDQAVALARAARALDPRSVAVNADLGWYFYFAGRLGEALSQCQAAAALEPSAPGPRLCRALTLEALHRDREAFDAWRASIAADDLTVPIEQFDAAFRDGGLPAVRRLRLRALKPESRSARYLTAVDAARLGDQTAAIAAVRAALAARLSWAPFVAVDPAFDRVRADVSLPELSGPR